MAWAKEMRNLAADIKSSHRDRTQYVKDVKDDTYELIARFQRELKEMARDLKDFLAKSENNRKKEFKAMIGEIQARIKEIKDDLEDFLAASEKTRIADFKAMMKDVRETVGGIEKSTRALLGDYKAERKEAAGYWAGLRGRRTVEREEVSEAPKKKKKKKIKMFFL